MVSSSLVRLSDCDRRKPHKKDKKLFYALCPRPSSQTFLVFYVQNCSLSNGFTNRSTSMIIIIITTTKQSRRLSPLSIFIIMFVVKFKWSSLSSNRRVGNITSSYYMSIM